MVNATAWWWVRTLCRSFGWAACGIDRRIDDSARDQIDLCHGIVGSERACEVDDVFGLPAGVGIASKLEVMPADESVDADHQNISAGSVGHDQGVDGWYAGNAAPCWNLYFVVSLFLEYAPTDATWHLRSAER